MGKPDQYRASDFIAVIPETAGIVSEIAKRVGCAWHTAKKYIDTYPTVAQAYADETEKVLDLGELALIRAVKGGEAWAVKYLLSTKGKGRGFSERQELDVTSDGGPLTLHVVYDDEPDSQAKKPTSKAG